MKSDKFLYYFRLLNNYSHILILIMISNFCCSRKKRVSDQRLAELETLMALARLKGKLVTVPIGFGRVDPAKM